MLPVSVLLALVAPVLGGPIKLSARDLTFSVQSCSAANEAQYFSCQAPGSVSGNSCCYENDGLILQTQFWDFDLSLLSSVSSNEARKLLVKKRGNLVARASSADNDVSQTFTIHGLWDDTCGGSYNQFCNPDWEFSDSDNIPDILSLFGQDDLLNTMQTYWISNSGLPESLWEHEFNKHGTCFNTIAPSCFTGDYQQYQNAVAYFQRVVDVWNTLPTYSFLLAAGIEPSTDGQYALLDIQDALSSNHGGKEVYIGCRNGAISEVWYFHNVKGNILNGQLLPVDSVTLSKCPENVWYLPK